jgi:transposase
LKIVYSTCCGVDVHKKFLVATIITSEGIQPRYQKKRFSTFNGDILRFKQWLLDNSCKDVCMESTGKYWVPVFNLLEDSISVTIANPKWVSAVKGNKDDNKDSKWIGDLFRLGLVRGSFIPCKPIRLLREFTRYRFRLVSCCASEKNRYQNVFTVCNVALDAVVSDMFGKSLDHYNFVVESIRKIDNARDILAQPYESQIALLCTIPGVDRNSAVTIISEIGVDMAQFSSSKRLCCWAGLTPGNNESAGKKKSVRITRAGVYLKPALVQVAHAAARDSLHPYFRIKYERIAKRRGKKRAIIAIARMILTAVFHMLSTGEVFNPSDLFKVDMPQELRDKQKDKALNQAVQLLISQGIIQNSDIQNRVFYPA